MFKSTPQQLKVLEMLFVKEFPQKSFTNLVQHKISDAKLIYKDNSDNTFYVFRTAKSTWRQITDNDIIESL